MTKPKTLAEILNPLIGKIVHTGEYYGASEYKALPIETLREFTHEAEAAINEYIKWVIGEDETDTRWDGQWRNGHKSRGDEARKRAGL